MKSSSLRKIAVAGVLSAVVVVLGITRIGLLPWFSGASVTILHVPAIIGAILEGPIVGFVIGLAFGLVSMLQAALAPTGPLDPAFAHPLVSIVPRLLIGPAAWLVYFLVNKLRSSTSIGSVVREVVAILGGAVIGSLTNTVLVLSALYLFAQQYVAKFLPSWTAVGSLVLINGVPEAIVAAILTLAIVGAWKNLNPSGKGSKLSREELD